MRTWAIVMGLAMACGSPDPAGTGPSGTGGVAADGSDGSDGSDGADGSDGSSHVGCPDGPLLALRWADRDETHAMLPGLVPTPAPSVTTVREERLDDGVDLLLRFDDMGRFAEVTITLLDPETGTPSFVWMDRLLRDPSGVITAEERWSGPSAEELSLEAVVSLTRDAEGRRVLGEVVDRAGRSTWLSWTWDGGCLVGYDRDLDDGRPGSVLSCAAGDRVEGWDPGDGEPEVAYLWPADPVGAPGPEGVQARAGDGFVTHTGWSWSAAGGLASSTDSGGEITTFVTDPDGTLVEASAQPPGGEPHVHTRWTVACESAPAVAR